MDYTLFNYAVVGGFLLLTLLVGLYAGKGIKDLREYAVANKIYGPGVLTMTYLATIIGGATTFGQAKTAFASGIVYAAIGGVGAVIAFLLVGKFIVPKMVPFIHKISQGEVMEEMYGPQSRIITGFTGFVSSACYVAMQVVALGYILQNFLGIDRKVGILLGGTIVVLYSSFGGIKAITITDVVQFIMLVILVPVLANLVTKEVGGIRALFSNLPQEKFQILNNNSLYRTLVILITWIFPSPTSPPYVQRMLMAKDKRDASGAYYVMAAFYPMYRFLILIIGLSAFILFPTISPNNVLSHVVSSFLPIPLHGLAVAGFLAIIMSSADSRVNAAGISLTNDVIKPLAEKSNKTINELRIVRIVTFLVGFIAVLVASFSSDILTVGIYGAGLWALVVTIPFIAGILGLRSSDKNVVITTIVAFLTFVISSIFLPKAINYLALLFGMIANFITFIFLHWKEHNGFLYQPYKDYVHPKEQIKQAMAEPQSFAVLATKFLKKYFPTPSNILQYSRHKVNEYGESHILISVFLCLNYMAPYFMWPENSGEYFSTLFILRIVGALFCLGFLLKPIWPQRLKPFFPLYWHAALLYCLPFSTTVMFSINGDNTMWLVTVIMFIMLLVVVVDWLSFLIIAFLGIGLGYLFAAKVLGLTHFPEVADKYTFIYTCLFGTIIGLVFARRRARNTALRVNRSKSIASTVGHEINHNSSPVLNQAQILAMKLKTYPFELQENAQGEPAYLINKVFFDSLQNGLSEIISGVKRNKKTIKAFKEIIENDVFNVDLRIVSLKECIQEALEEFPFEANQQESLQLYLEEDFDVKIPPQLFRHVISNLLRNAYKHGGSTNVTMKINKASRELTILDRGYGIPEDCMHRIFDLFYTTMDSGSGVGLAFTKALVESFNGSITCQSQQGKDSYTLFTIQFPQDDQ